MFVNLLLFAVFVIAVYLFLEFKKRVNYFKSRGILSEKWKFPMGDVTGVGSEFHFVERLEVLYEKYKDQDVMFGFFNMLSPTIIPTDPEFIKDILVRDFNTFADRGVYHNEKDDMLTGHLFSLEGERWRFLRQKLSPTFTSGKMKMLFHTIADKGEELIQAIVKRRAKGPVDAKQLSVCFTSDVIGSCAFGIECGALQNDTSEIIEKSRVVFNLQGYRLFYTFFLECFQDVARALHLRQFDKDLETYFVTVITETLQHRNENNVQRKDFLNLLNQLYTTGTIEGEESDSRKITFEELVAQAFIFFFAGFETTSTTLGFMFYEVSQNQEIQGKIREEVLKAMKNHDGEITYEAIQEMTYLTQVINETLRKYPPIGFLFRKANSDYKVKNTKHVIVKDSHLIVPTFAIHRDKKYYPDPEKFDPNRFTPEEMAKRPTVAFLPFGDGNRNCIGMRFAMMEAKYAFAKILSEYKFTLDPKSSVPLVINRMSTVYQIKSDILVNFEKI